jgi:heme-degrading monooxygenase HmoA
MYGRMTRLQASPDTIDKGISFFKENVAPKARTTPGNAGAILLVDRKTGAAIGITLWETAEALNASEQFGVSSRTQSAAAAGGSIVDVDRYEQVFADRAGPPKEGSYVRLNIVSGSPDKLDNVIKFMQKQVVPVLKAQKGYRATIMNVNRTTGRSSVSTVWDTRADLEASESAVSGLRRDAADAAGAKDVKVEIFESAHSEIKQASPV